MDVTFMCIGRCLLFRGDRGKMSNDQLAYESLNSSITIGTNPALSNYRACIGSDVGSKKPPVYVHNIVSTSIVHSNRMPINLQMLSMYLPCSSYNRKRFAAITIRIDNPRCTALLFTSGKLVITGGRTWNECLLASLCIARILSRTIVDSQFFIINCQLQNVVAHSEVPMRVGHRLDIQRMYRERSVECTYQRNQFPGLIFRGKNYPVVMLCFFSGKIVLTGGKSIRDISDGWDMLWELVSNYVVRND